MTQFYVTAMHNIRASDTGVNFSKTFKIFNSFHLIFNGDWITSACACMSDRERSTHVSFSRMNNPYSTGTSTRTVVTVNGVAEKHQGQSWK